MTPGDIVMMLNEMGGMRVQTTSPSLGAASVRIQGMRGRYTRVLSDGLPLFGEVGGLGLLQIPPMDLGQVEVIKGVASALYGAGAMGGVINLLSRRPGEEPAEEFLLNRSTRGATDAVTFLSRSFARGWSGSLLGGGHWQETNDVNGDAWADLAGLFARRRASARVLGWRRRSNLLCHNRLYLRGSQGWHAGWRGPPGHWPALRRSPRDTTIRRGCRGPVPDQGPVRRDGPRGNRTTESRSSVRRGLRAGSARHGVWRNSHPWNRRSTDLGRGIRDRARRLYGARRAPIRL